MTSDGEQASRSTRRSAPKVRTGCVTCKVRHVKCDETKPACNRCVFTGRKCDGYEVPKRKYSATPLDSSNPAAERFPLAKIPGTPAERRALHFFFSKTAPNIAGFFEPVFWTRIVIQLAQTEPAVRYAVQAIGATYAANTERDASALLGADDFALKAYNKAISAIVAANPNAEGRKKMTLITCVLFVCIEFMRGEMEAAVKHIHSGLKLLSEWNPMQSVAANGDRRSSSLDEPSDKEMCDDLTAMFSRLHLQAKFSMHSQPPTWHSMHSPDKLQPDSIATFTTLSEARDTLFSIASECVAVILPIVEAKYAKRVQCEMMVQQRRLESHLRVWRRHFESSIAVKKAMCTTHLAAMGNMLMIYAISMHIWVAECLSAEEEVFDKYGGEYETVVALAKGILDAGAGCERTAGAAFQFELGIIPPLHMIGSKCRFPELRRQILDILTSAHWREGLFDSVASARFIELVARVEAEEVDPATNMPTERARVHFADQAHFLGRPQVENSDRRVVLFLKPEGVYGPWVMREEVLDGQVWGVFPIPRYGMVRRGIIAPIAPTLGTNLKSTRLTGQRVRVS